MSGHRPLEALHELQKALELCPVSNKKEFTKILFYMGTVLQKLGFGGIAVRTWASAAGLRKNGPCSKMLERMTNEYGMFSEGGDENSDFRAFHAIHLSRYLLSRGTHRFGSSAEKDMVYEVIRSAWDEVSENFQLSGVPVSEKLEIFRAQIVIFPYLKCPENWTCEEISYNFRTNERIGDDDRCGCGSGLPRKYCCGRIPSEDELENGLF